MWTSFTYRVLYTHVHTHTHTHTPAALGQWPKHPAPLPRRQLQYSEPGAVAITKQHRGCNHRAQGHEKQPNCLILRRFSPSPWVQPDSRQGRRGQLGLVGRTCASVRTQKCLPLGPHGLQPARLLCPWDSQARILEWVDISCSRSSCPRDWTCVSCVSSGRFFTTGNTWEAPGWKGVPLNSEYLRKNYYYYRRGGESGWGCKLCSHLRRTRLPNSADPSPIHGPPLLLPLPLISQGPLEFSGGKDPGWVCSEGYR